jgi:hypothetical protein
MRIFLLPQDENQVQGAKILGNSSGKADGTKHPNKGKLPLRMMVQYIIQVGRNSFY